MDLNFANVITELNRESSGGNFALDIANEARAPRDYALSMYLPDRERQDYTVTSGNVRVVGTMAGLVGMDSPYPPGGVVAASTFLEKTAKLAVTATLNEETLREIQLLVLRRNAAGVSSADVLAQEVFNFTRKVLIQSGTDVNEWLKGQALAFGLIDWTFNKKALKVDYGIPAEQKFDTATAAESYVSGADSTFWADHRAAEASLRYNVAARLVHVDTLRGIIANAANRIEIVSRNGNEFTLTQLVGEGTNLRRSTDALDTATFTALADEGEWLDPTDTSKTIREPFFPKGRLSYIARAGRSGYRVGEGATPDPNDALAIGYGHVAPTVEGGAAGLFVRTYTPENRPYQLTGDMAENFMPVIEDEKKLALLSTDE